VARLSCCTPGRGLDHGARPLDAAEYRVACSAVGTASLPEGERRHVAGRERVERFVEDRRGSVVDGEVKCFLRVLTVTPSSDAS
jgi:hypothetical protein